MHTHWSGIVSFTHCEFCHYQLATTVRLHIRHNGLSICKGTSPPILEIYVINIKIKQEIWLKFTILKIFLLTSRCICIFNFLLYLLEIYWPLIICLKYSYEKNSSIIEIYTVLQTVLLIKYIFIIQLRFRTVWFSRKPIYKFYFRFLEVVYFFEKP